ncbi:MAG: autotransporter outer membrane beta-barrel domain-containing protein [Pseudomonadales bacterium]|nr:autotransporter outer membrane beta-barrel domain-containing protein [Pseudomonadales bacterium]
MTPKSEMLALLRFAWQRCLGAAAIVLLSVSFANAGLDDLAGDFSSDLEELSAISNQATYDQLLVSGCTDSQANPSASCGGKVFISWQTVRELVHTANELTNSGSTLFSLGVDLESLGFSLRWTAGEEFSTQGDMSNNFVGGQLSGLTSRISALRHGGNQHAFNDSQDRVMQNAGILIAAQYLDRMSGGSAGDVDAKPNDAKPTYEWSPWGSFLNYSYLYGDRQPSLLEDAYDIDGVNLNGGFDYRFSNNHVAGVMLGYQQEDLDFDSSSSIVDGVVEMTGISIQPFYLYQSDQWYFNMSMAYQMMDFETQRSIRYPSLNPDVASTNTVSVSDSEATALSGSITAGYTFFPKYALLQKNAVTLEPYLSLDFSSVEVDGFTETDLQNDGFNFVVMAHEVDSVETSMGLRLQCVLSPSFGVVVPYMDLQYRIQLEDESREIKAYYFNASEALTDIDAAAFVLPTDAPDSSYQVLAIGLSAIIRGASISGNREAASGGLQVYVSYQTFIGLRFYDQSQLTGGLRYEL